MKKVVLFDFHNTLATCDGWLELEIRTLPGLALEKLADRGAIAGLRPGPGMLAEASKRFQALRQGVRDSGVELSAIEGTRRVLEQMGLDVPELEIEDVVRELEEALLPSVEAVPGVAAALEQLRDKGYRLGVVSSAGYPPFVEMALEGLGLRMFFSEIVTSAGEGIYKSNPEIFRRAAGRLSASPEDAVHVGDHAVYDVKAAKTAGLSAIWFAAQARRTAQLHGTSWEEAARSGAGADAIVMSMAELPGAIERLG